MKKIGSALLGIIALLSLSCTKDEETQTFVRTGNVTFTASIENCVAKATITNTGEARWTGGETIGVVMNDGSIVGFDLDGTGGTRKALFTGTVPDGKEIGDLAVYPDDYVISYSEGKMSVSLPSEFAYGVTIENSLMIAPVEESYEITFAQLMSYMTLRVTNIPAEARKIELSADNSLSGDYSVEYPASLQTGLQAKAGNGTVSYVFDAAPEKNLTFNYAVPVGTYTGMTISVYDTEGEKILETSVLPSPTNFERAAIRSYDVALEDYTHEYPEIEGCVNVCGIYWAAGNLQYCKDSGDAGFQPGWRIAPYQWHWFNYDDYTTFDKERPSMDPDAYNHFNFGGIADSFGIDATSYIIGREGLDISGKMYVDQSATTETTDFAAAQYGDVAYWASNGKFRMPTENELKALAKDASWQYGFYTTADGHKLNGFLFTDPVGERTESNTPVEFTDEDLSKGVFLPQGGRRANSSTEVYINANKQATYWTGQMLDAEHVVILSQISDEFIWDYYTEIENAAFDVKAGFMIRPVLTNPDAE